jgi:dUTP pyrophosphatase
MYILYLYVDSADDKLVEKYKEAASRHNLDLVEKSHPDSGFDVYLPSQTDFIANKASFINFRIKCKMVKNVQGASNPAQPSAFYMYPRSSISKTRLRLANNVGIIDSGYRGHLGGFFDTIHTQSGESLDQFHRLVQICTPDLSAFKVIVIDDEAYLGETERGARGFGSTGTN